MPELPEVETVRRGLAPAMVGARIDEGRVAASRTSVFPFPPRSRSGSSGRRIVDVDRRAKYLLFALDSGETLIAHLGMSGSFRIEKARFRRRAIFLASARRIRSTITSSWSSITAAPSPTTTRAGSASWIWRRAERSRTIRGSPGSAPSRWRPTSTPRCLAKLFAGARTPLKAALLDQKRIAGLGNIYVCEALFRARLAAVEAGGHPRGRARRARPAPPRRSSRRSATCSRRRSRRAARPFAIIARPNGELGYFQHVFKVYDREGQPCVRERCRGVVARTVHSGRSTFYCAICQR